jgi:putative ABC transport system permease protein
MKAVGAKNSHIMVLFLIESGILGMVGGVIGVVLGLGISKGVEIAAQSILGSSLLKASITLELIAGALLFSFFIGMMSGVIPAKQAAQLNPVDALRYE